LRAFTRLLIFILVIGTAGCVTQTRFNSTLQPDGWNAQPVSISCRFAPDADLDSATGTPVGDEGYYLYILTDIDGHRDYSNPLTVAISYKKNPGGHSWIMIESPENRVEYGHNGNFGLEKPRYQSGVYQWFKENRPNPISYLWEEMSDGRLETNIRDRTPTFVWRMPITKLRYQLIQAYVKNRNYERFSLRERNCVDMVTDAAALAGINLIHRLRLTLPKETTVLGTTLHAWTDPEYSVLEFSTPDLLQVDLRQLVQFGIGSDVTEWYRGLRR
jgi:hypothetical protein